MNILDYIPTGHRNAVSRETLSMITHLSDRKLRDLISECNQNSEDTVIINLQDGMGYFLPDENEDALVKQWIKLGDARYASFGRNVSAGERYLKLKQKKQKQNNGNLDGQMNIFDFLK